MGIFDFFKKKNKEEIAKESKIEEKNKNGIMSHLENFKSSLYKNKFIGNYKLFNWNIWLVSEGEKIAKTFVKVFEKELINIYDENGNKFYVDEAYNAVFISPLNSFSNWLYRIFDRKITDGLVNQIGLTALLSGQSIRKLQTGRTGFYIIAMVCIGLYAYKRRWLRSKETSRTK